MVKTHFLSDKMFRLMQKALDKSLSKNGMPAYDTADPIKADETAKLNFIAWGDPQISLLSPLRAARVKAACRDILHAQGVFDALVLLGDITEYGARCEYKMTAELLAPMCDKIKSVFAVSGNHDIRLRNYKKQLSRFNAFLKSVKGGRYGNDEHYYFSDEVNGYPFIMLGADRSCFEASYLSDRQLDFLENELSKAAKDKPVFVFNHQPLKHTNGLPVTWLGKGNWRGTVGRESDKLRSLFEKHGSGNLIYITGHLHYCTGQYTYEDHGAFKAISLPTVGVINHGVFNRFTQGYLFSVYEDRIVARARIFGEGKYPPEDIVHSEITIKINEWEKNL